MISSVTPLIHNKGIIIDHSLVLTLVTNNNIITELMSGGSFFCIMYELSLSYRN